MRLPGLLPLLDGPLAPARNRLAAGDAVVLGAPDAAKAALIAALAEGRPALVLVDTADRADALVEELAAWLGEPARLRHFPPLEGLPYERAGFDGEAAEERLAVLQAIGHAAAPPVVVTCVQALAQHTIAPATLRGTSEVVRVGMRLPLDAFLRRLERLGYAFETLVEAPGQASRRGGIVDVFPPDAALPLRIEFWGDEVESLRRYHAATQRTTERVEVAEIGPAREAQIDGERVRALRAGLELGNLDADSLAQIEDELAALEGGEARSLGLYGPFLLDATLLDHLPPDTLLITDEAREASLRHEELDRQAAAVRAELEAAGTLPRGLPLPHEARPALWARIDGWDARVDLQRFASEGLPDLSPVPSPARGGVPSTAAPPSASDGASSRSEPREAPAGGAPPLAGEGTGERSVLPLPFRAAAGFGGRLRSVFSDVLGRVRAGDRTVVVSQQSARLAELFGGEGLSIAPTEALVEPPPAGSLNLLHGSLAHGWALTLDDGPLLLLTDAEIFGFTKQRRAQRPRGPDRAAFLADLTPGDLVVHVEHGIARFAGLVRRVVGEVEREFLELRYAERDRLFVPTDQVDRVDRYVGPSDHPPQLSRLGSGEWARTKERVRRAITDLAQELLQVYAAREVERGHAFNEDTPWQQEMEAAFPYVETADQLHALRDVKDDMQQPRPMDRVLIGDVGFGKTEVAVRAAFKAVMDGKQVAVLVPTTVLAQQHYQTFIERMSGFPVKVDVLSRFRSDDEARGIVAALAGGTIDILIGTHRILGREIKFKDLGLVVVDEEQRFGVGHKERLKQLRATVDVLTLSATPIPRTLHMSLSGIRDMSTMTTAPEDRLPVKTFVSEWDDRLAREAILRELDRGGQVYIVHNRVQSIELFARKLRELVPEAEFSVGHGQMPEEHLEQTMLAFQKGECDVLVCTTIIESGLDIPNVNTILINQANRLGLSQLYQLRGRVGRGAHRAYAYLFYDKNTALTETAQKRLQTIFEATELGAGFQIAMRDLEIRGAGNLLGAEQSGHIGAVGYELYSRMLAEAVARMRALQREEAPPPAPPAPVTVDLPLTAHLPEAYIPDLNLRLAMYQRLGAITETAAVDEVAAELRDRFGPPPPVMDNLLDIVRIKALARAVGLTSVTAEDGLVVLRAPRPIPNRELLTIFGDDVQVGSTQVRVPQRGDWRKTLLAVLHRLDPATAPPPTPQPAAKADYGTFAPRDGATRPASLARTSDARTIRQERRERPSSGGRRPWPRR